MLLGWRACYYDPTVGRFLSKDPIGFAGGNNFYSYVDNNPANFSDPFGLESAPPGGPPFGRS
ncbi:MAG: RHS repeat-associated core domain-containing protein [Acidobacteria bacterium]|nr:RHS repeat-associated core domain-containing protein [Acidobacteriota bacterium]